MNEIILSLKAIETLELESEQSFPNETYGFIFGIKNKRKWIQKIIPISKLRARDTNDNNGLELLDYKIAERYAQNNYLELLGAYQSVIGDFDMNKAKLLFEVKAHFSYLILSIINGELQSINSWSLDLNLRKMEKEKILINAAQLIC